MTSLYLPSQQDDPVLRDEFENYAVASNLDVLGTTFEETLYYNPLFLYRGYGLRHQKLKENNYLKMNGIKVSFTEKD